VGGPYGNERVYRTFDCKVTNEHLASWRHLVLTVAGRDSFRVRWLTKQTCR
jgi:hypothetical protein